MLIPKFLRIPIILFSYCRRVWLMKTLNTRRKLERYQRRRIEAHLRFLYQESPFYSELIESDDLSAWRGLPLLTKEDIMENFSELNTRGISREEALTVAIEAERSRDFSSTIHGVTVGLSSGTSFTSRCETACTGSTIT